MSSPSAYAGDLKHDPEKPKIMLVQRSQALIYIKHCRRNAARLPDTFARGAWPRGAPVASIGQELLTAYP